MRDDLVIGIAGAGGDGVILLGELLARACARVGLHTVLLKSFGPQIRGGESSVRIRISTHPLSWAGDAIDALLLFNWDGLRRFQNELQLKPCAPVIVDSLDPTPLDEAPVADQQRPLVRQVPLEELALQSASNKQAKNMVMAGLICESFGWPADGLAEYIRLRFRRHGERTIETNLRAIEAGREYAREHLEIQNLPMLSYERRAPLHFFNGDEAFAYGALSAGCRFMAGYPISPASEILEWMSRELPQVGGLCVQAEDEISAACMAIGASYGGALALTATSGPGLSLKQEAIGLATMAEIPLVVCDVQRCGPSTGIPTRPEQADLMAAIHGGHGDSPRIVLAATSVGDCYELAQTAFELAERFQTPVLVLLDQYLGQNHQTLENFEPRILAPPALAGAEPLASRWREPAARAALEPGYARYQLDGPDGISACSLPGQPGGEFTAVGIEHGPDGDVTSSPAMHQAMSAKRAAKLQAAARDYQLLSRWDPPSAAPVRPLSLLTWGSSFGVCVEAAQRLSAAGLPTRVLAPQILYPLPVEALAQWLSGCGELAVLETNFSGQFFHHLRAYLDLPAGTQAYHRAGGMPLMLGEVLGWLQSSFGVSKPLATERLEVLAQ